MSAVEMSRAEAVALMQRIMDADYASADEVVDQALAYRPVPL
ncbi:hypothetical protein ABZY14_35805 [Streptomyces sp. NPDC006617]